MGWGMSTRGRGVAVLSVLVVAGRGWRAHERPHGEFLAGLDRVLPRQHRLALKVRASTHHELLDGDTPWPAWPEVADPTVRAGGQATRCGCCPNGPEYDCWVAGGSWLAYNDWTWRSLCDGVVGPEDVRAYLTRPETREVVIAEAARAVLKRRPDIVIGHSLGAVVAVEALARCRDLHAPSAVLTLGAPFPWPRFVERWSPQAREWLAAPGLTWRNVVDLSDLVTGFVVPSPEVYAGAVNVVVDNDHHVALWPGSPGWDPWDAVDPGSTHGARHYLAHPVVAETFAALLEGTPERTAYGAERLPTPPPVSRDGEIQAAPFPAGGAGPAGKG